MDIELRQFVRDALAAGASRDATRQALAEAGWPEDEVRSALGAFASVEFPVPVPRPKPYLSARDAFTYLLLFLTLYISAIGLGSLLFQLIHRLLPDPAMEAFAARVAREAVRWSTASLLISFPVFLWLQRSVRLATARDPEKRASRVRKWLSYLTLFVAASVLIVDLITLVYNLLGGELTGRFVLKVGTVGAIAGAAFSYYLRDLRRDESETEGVAKSDRVDGGFAIVATVVVAVALAGGLWAAGSPQAARALDLDRQRVSHLEGIADAADDLWEARRLLPSSLDELGAERVAGAISIVDPETAEPYEYRVTGEQSFELCASFDAESAHERRSKRDRAEAPGSFWSHPAGRHCYEVAIR